MSHLSQDRHIYQRLGELQTDIAEWFFHPYNSTLQKYQQLQDLVFTMGEFNASLRDMQAMLQHMRQNGEQVHKRLQHRAKVILCGTSGLGPAERSEGSGTSLQRTGSGKALMSQSQQELLGRGGATTPRRDLQRRSQKLKLQGGGSGGAKHPLGNMGKGKGNKLGKKDDSEERETVTQNGITLDVESKMLEPSLTSILPKSKFPSIFLNTHESSIARRPQGQTPTNKATARSSGLDSPSKLRSGSLLDGDLEGTGSNASPRTPVPQGNGHGPAKQDQPSDAKSPKRPPTAPSASTMLWKNSVGISDSASADDARAVLHDPLIQGAIDAARLPRPATANFDQQIHKVLEQLTHPEVVSLLQVHDTKLEKMPPSTVYKDVLDALLEENQRLEFTPLVSGQSGFVADMPNERPLKDHV